jgi:class 3 adenylate cyclase
MTVGLAEGSGLAFESRGPHQVKGLERPIEVYRLI